MGPTPDRRCRQMDRGARPITISERRQWCNFWPIGDVVDEHSYPHPAFPFDNARYGEYVKVVGEFGGHGLPVEGHLWDNQANNWGYGGLPKNADEYKERYVESIRRLLN